MDAQRSVFWDDLACAGLAWDLVQADKHKRTCPKCQGRDFLAIALDLAHLAQTA